MFYTFMRVLLYNFLPFDMLINDDDDVDDDDYS